MTALEELLKTVEKNYQDRNKREKIEYYIGGKKFDVVLLTRAERFELYFSRMASNNTFKGFYDWVKPAIYKCFQLKDLALKAKEEGYIKNYYDIIEMLFSPDEIQEIINFILRENQIGMGTKEAIEAQKK